MIIGCDEQLIIILRNDETTGSTLNLIFGGLAEPVHHLLDARFRNFDNRRHHGINNA